MLRVHPSQNSFCSSTALSAVVLTYQRLNRCRFRTPLFFLRFCVGLHPMCRFRLSVSRSSNGVHYCFIHMLAIATKFISAAVSAISSVSSPRQSRTCSRLIRLDTRTSRTCSRVIRLGTRTSRTCSRAIRLGTRTSRTCSRVIRLCARTSRTCSRLIRLGTRTDV